MIAFFGSLLGSWFGVLLIQWYLNRNAPKPSDTIDPAARIYNCQRCSRNAVKIIAGRKRFGHCLEVESICSEGHRWTSIVPIEELPKELTETQLAVDNLRTKNPHIFS